MKFLHRISALCLVLPLAGCTTYCSVSQKRPRIESDSPEGRSLARALNNGTRHPDAALGACLDCASISAQRLRRIPQDVQAQADYNFAVSRVFDLLRESKLKPWDAPVRVRGGGGEWLLTFENGRHPEADPRKVGLLPADRYEFYGAYIRTRTLKDGLGAPLVATGTEEDFTQADHLGRGKHVYYGMTGLLRFEGRKCVLTTEDPLALERVRFDGHSFPLAADFTAPLALELAGEKPLLIGLQRLMRPQKYAHTAGIARLQPYDPAKIPVICVHGLLDSPLTWIPFINTLRGDPAIRERYQFWFYGYPSGYPYPYSAAILRQRLDEVNARYPHHKKEVLIGHSMGGLISRTMTTDSGMKLWNAYFEQPPERLDASPESRKFLTDALIFRHRPEVSRVVFISSPHRGADIATSWIGWIGSHLVKVPGFLLQINEETRNLRTLDKGKPRLGLMPNSIETMSENNPFLKTIGTIPTVPGVPYYSIMGDRGKGGNKDRTKPVSTDGYVPYWSSHLDGARSELIVPCNHSAHQSVEAIEEVRRILMLDVR
jgi:hypothetical protein